MKTKLETKTLKCNLTGRVFNIQLLVRNEYRNGYEGLPKNARYDTDCFTNEGIYNIYFTPSNKQYGKLSTNF